MSMMIKFICVETSEEETISPFSTFKEYQDYFFNKRKVEEPQKYYLFFKNTDDKIIDNKSFLKNIFNPVETYYYKIIELTEFTVIKEGKDIKLSIPLIETEIETLRTYCNCMPLEILKDANENIFLSTSKDLAKYIKDNKNISSKLVLQSVKYTILDKRYRDKADKTGNLIFDPDKENFDDFLFYNEIDLYKCQLYFFENGNEAITFVGFMEDLKNIPLAPCIELSLVNAFQYSEMNLLTNEEKQRDAEYLSNIIVENEFILISFNSKDYHQVSKTNVFQMAMRRGMRTYKRRSVNITYREQTIPIYFRDYNSFHQRISEEVCSIAFQLSYRLKQNDNSESVKNSKWSEINRSEFTSNIDNLKALDFKVEVKSNNKLYSGISSKITADNAQPAKINTIPIIIGKVDDDWNEKLIPIKSLQLQKFKEISDTFIVFSLNANFSIRGTITEVKSQSLFDAILKLKFKSNQPTTCKNISLFTFSKKNGSKVEVFTIDRMVIIRDEN